MALVKKYEYVELWKLQISQRATIEISRMIDPIQEKQFFLNEEYLKKLESGEENKKEGKARLDIKKNEEKYYLNAIIEGYDHQNFRTKGFSIFRHQIPNLIEALQNIYDGHSDKYIREILHESGFTNNVPSNASKFSTNDNYDEVTPKKNDFKIWFETLNEEQKMEVKNLENSDWTEKEIRLAFDSKYSKN